MKLIIDIDENIYNQIREGFYEYNVDKMGIAIVDGIPLDKIKAEIFKQFEGCYLEEDMTDERKAEHKAYENVLQIIDKYKEDNE